MNMDPHQWVEFAGLTDGARERIDTIYPYLKTGQCTFQEKESGVFMKQANSVKVEKLLDPAQPDRPAADPAAARTRR